MLALQVGRHNRQTERDQTNMHWGVNGVFFNRFAKFIFKNMQVYAKPRIKRFQDIFVQLCCIHEFYLHQDSLFLSDASKLHLFM